MRSLIFLLLISFSTYALEITIHKKDAVVWGQDQVINGDVSNLVNTRGVLILNGNPIPFQISTDKTFSVPIKLTETNNQIYIEIDSAGTKLMSDTLNLTLGYKPLPELYVYAEVSGLTVSLHCKIINNPNNELLLHKWIQDEDNPAQVTFSSESDSVITLSLPTEIPNGEYYFSVYGITSNDDTAKARTFITIDGGEVYPFNIKTDHAEWIDKAVVYQVTPYSFVDNGRFGNVTKKIPELAELGINTIYLQPIYVTKNGGQGYDVMDYFKIRKNYGSERDLHDLIKTARQYNMHVILDFVPNHSSIYHAFAQDAIKYGTESHYYNFYQREKDNSLYSSNEHIDDNGFVYYFDWSYMPNLNYDNPELQNYILEAAKYWVNNFEVDGYRFDAVWAVTARAPEFTKKLRLALKQIKPEILLLAEDKASQDQVFDERFDAAYDWTSSYEWVSQWSWQVSYDPNNNRTIFNTGSVSGRPALLRRALNNNGKGYAYNAKILRFLENNDTFRFIKHHGLEGTKMAAALLFSLNGIPMMYNGQEVGNTEHPYDTWQIFWDTHPIKYFDKQGLFGYYKNLIELRKKYPALTSDNFTEITSSNDYSAYTFSFRRWNEDQNIFAALNFSGDQYSFKINIPVDKMNLDSTKTYYLTSLLNGKVYSGKPSELKSVSLTLQKTSADIFLFADSIASLVNVASEDENEIPEEFNLYQNYPNPFNPVTTIEYSLPVSNKVLLKIYDILGREVSTLKNEIQPAGHYVINFDGTNLTSGIYFYRLECDKNIITKKMMLIK